MSFRGWLESRAADRRVRRLLRDAPTRSLAAVVEAGYRDDRPLRYRFVGSAKYPLVIRDDLESL